MPRNQRAQTSNQRLRRRALRGRGRRRRVTCRIADLRLGVPMVQAQGALLRISPYYVKLAEGAIVKQWRHEVGGVASLRALIPR